MAIPNGVIFLWTGTNASIPAGWSRVSDLDARFPKGIANGSTNPNVTGGSLSHTHTGSSHTHSMQSHTHLVYYGGASGTNQDSGSSDQNGIANFHGHPSQTSDGPSSVSVSSVTVTYNSVSNNPPYKTVIFITPTTVAGGLPNLASALSDDTGFTNNAGKYGGYYKHDGANGTEDYNTQFIAGASGGTNAGGTGGSTQNTHTLTHSHTVSHAHPQLTTPLSTGPFNDDTGGSDMASKFHTHTTTIDATVLTTSDTPSTTTSETVEPLYKKMLMIQNRSSTVYTPVGIIGMWLGTVANVPSNFELVSSLYGYYVKITSNTGEIGQTGGSNTHTHAVSSHSHASISHTHTGSTSVFGSDTRRDGNSQGGVRNHNHGVGTDPSNMTLDSATTTADSSNNEPEYRTVAFIKYKGEKGGAFLFNML